MRTQQGSLLRFGDYTEEDFDREFARQHGRTPPLAEPEFGACAPPRDALGGSGRLNTARGIGWPPGAWSLPRMLELAASTFADSVAFGHPDAALRDYAGRPRPSEGVGGAGEAQGILRDHKYSGPSPGAEVELESGYALGCWARPGRTGWSKGRYPAPSRCEWWPEEAPGRSAATDIDQQHVRQSSRPPRLAQSTTSRPLRTMIRNRELVGKYYTHFLPRTFSNPTSHFYPNILVSRGAEPSFDVRYTLVIHSSNQVRTNERQPKYITDT